MNRFLSLIIPLIMVVLFISCNAGIPDTVFQEKDGPYLSEVGQDLYMVENFNNGGNICFLVADKGVLVVDAGYYPSGSDKVVELIRQVTKMPVKYVVYTHCHTDHVGGISAFNEKAVIIAHRNLAANLDKYVIPGVKGFRDELQALGDDSLRLKYGDSFNDRVRMEIRKPGTVFEDEHTINMGNYIIELYFPGICHTNDNILVLFKDQKVLHTGDLVFNQRHPFIGKQYLANPARWRDVVAEWAQEDLSLVIPGHGEKGGTEILKAQADYFDTLINAVAEYNGSDLSIEAIAEEVHNNNFSDWEYAGYFGSAIEVLMGER